MLHAHRVRANVKLACAVVRTHPVTRSSTWRSLSKDRPISTELLKQSESKKVDSKRECFMRMTHTCSNPRPLVSLLLHNHDVCCCVRLQSKPAVAPSILLVRATVSFEDIRAPLWMDIGLHVGVKGLCDSPNEVLLMIHVLGVCPKH